jgi:GNAT superfamily N-acetyltransferase
MNRISHSTIRRATMRDVDSLRQLSNDASRDLCVPDYTPLQVETAMRYGAGVDPRLIADGTYYVIEDNGRLLAAGGWSYRAAICGLSTGDYEGDPHDVLDPTLEAARMRGFCVRPDYARRGLGRTLLALCERAAAYAGFTRAELMATITGRRMYLACGYADVEPVTHIFPNAVAVTMYRMGKTLSPVERGTVVPALLALPADLTVPAAWLN